MDELAWLISDANPHASGGLPAHAEQTLDEIMQGRRRARTSEPEPLVDMDIALMSTAAVVTLMIGMQPTPFE